MFKRNPNRAPKKRAPVLTGREQDAWQKKRSYAAVNIFEVLKPPDLADALAEVAVASADDHLEHQRKRARAAPPAPPAPAYEVVVAQLERGEVPATQVELKASDFGLQLAAGFRLKPHQVEAVSWAIHKETHPFRGIRGGLLSMEMGTGKSLVSMSVIMAQHAAGQCATLAIMPKTLMSNYLMDVGKFFGASMRVLIWDREVLGDRFFDFTSQTPYKNHVIIVSYDTLLALAKSLGVLSKGKGGNAKLHRVAETFYATEWFRVICDESHRFANHKTQLWEALMRLKPGRRLCMTGTAVKNCEEDLFAQLVFCGLTGLPDPRAWTIQTYEELNLRSAVFRKSLLECELNLPERKEIRQYVELSQFEKNVYNVLMGKSTSIMAAFKAKKALFANVLEMFTRLRQACIAPHLIAPQSKTKKLTETEQKRLEPGALLGVENLALEAHVRSPEGPAGFESGKMLEMVRIIRAIPADEKVIVFCEWAGAVHLAASVLARAFGEASVVIVDGETEGRDDAFAHFKLDPTVRFLACTGVASHGLTLVESNHVVLLSPGFTSYMKEQAAARVWRIGQTRPVFVWELIVKGSIENRMLTIVEEKHSIRDALLEGGVNSEAIDALLGDGEML